MTGRRKPEREVAEEHRRLTRDQEIDVAGTVLLVVIPAAVLIAGCVLMAAGRCG